MEIQKGPPSMNLDGGLFLLCLRVSVVSSRNT
jgi:hypothetical protein